MLPESTSTRILQSLWPDLEEVIRTLRWLRDIVQAWRHVALVDAHMALAGWDSRMST